MHLHTGHRDLAVKFAEYFNAFLANSARTGDKITTEENGGSDPDIHILICRKTAAEAVSYLRLMRDAWADEAGKIIAALEENEEARS